MVGLAAAHGPDRRPPHRRGTAASRPAAWPAPDDRLRTRPHEPARAGLVADDTSDDLVEWDYGGAEGRTTAEIREERPGWDIWDDGVADGESVDDVGERADRVIARARRVRGDVALVAHADLLCILCARWFGLPPVAARHLTLDPASWCILGWERETPAILAWNVPALTNH